jgi:hypothetical protein
MLEYGHLAAPVPADLELDGQLWWWIYEEMRPRVQEHAEREGGFLAEGPPQRQEISGGMVLYVWPAVRERVPVGGTENAGTQGSAQQQG